MTAKIIALISLLPFSLYAQTNVDLTTNFDSYISPAENDLITNFPTSNSSFSQNAGGGITGGSIVPTGTNHNLNTAALFKFKYANNIGRTSTTSIDFNFNSSLVNPNQSEWPAAIWLRPKSDWNQYIIAALERKESQNTFQLRWSRLLGVKAPDSSNTPASTPSVILSNGWYRLQLIASIVGGSFGDKISVRSELYYLGANGVTTPTLVASSDGEVYDVVFAQDQISVLLVSAQWGGAAALDNFRFSGYTNDNIQTTERRFEAQISQAVKVSWPSVSGKIYTVEWSPDLSINSWQILVSDYYGTGEDLYVYDQLGSYSKKFYRIKEQ
jgi:hypothetical protein